MGLNKSRTEQFAEALYFQAMASAGSRIKALGRRHGLSGKALRDEVLSFARKWAQMTNRPVSEGVCRQVRQAG